VPITDPGAAEIAGRSRGTPRIANRLLRRVRDFAEVRAEGVVTEETARAALKVYDAVREAGLSPNHKTEAYRDEWLILKIIALARELKRFPVSAEFRMRSRTEKGFPSESTIRKFESKPQLMARVADYCKTHKGNDDVLSLCTSSSAIETAEPVETCDECETFGFVYLLRAGRYYKVGMTNACGRRERELAIQLPEKAQIVHQIRTDDPAGIEKYWHRRFHPLRKNGEWFALTAAEVKAFKRRKFM
jgi:hypothetical protein